MRMMRNIRTMTAAIALLAAGTGVAAAQSCEETQFRSEQGEAYLAAENFMFEEPPNTSAALAKLNELKQMELNCYERAAATGLGVQIKVEAGDYRGAAQDLQNLVNSGSIPADQRLSTLENIALLYLQADQRTQALQAFDRWISAGGRPNRDRMFLLGQLYYQAGDKRKSLDYMERVFEIDGPGAERTVYDFLILLYDETGQRAKRARLLESLLQRDPSDKQLWQIIASDYYEAGDDRKAFEMQKAMYFAGLLEESGEIMQIVNFYNSFDVPFEAAKVLEKEMNAGRIEKNFQNLDQLANLYQVAREYERAIPVIKEMARIQDTGRVYERLGRAYFEVGRGEDAEEALRQAQAKGNMKEPGYGWVLIGQTHYNRDERAKAREAFRKATEYRDGRAGGQGWLDFMQNEDDTQRALVVFEAEQDVITLKAEQERCEQVITVVGEDAAGEECQTVAQRLEEAQAALAEIKGQS